MSDLEDSNDDESTVKKKGKKKYYPFGTPTHNSNAYSKFAHINNAQTQDFANLLASPTRTFEVHEAVPEKRAKRRPNTSPKKSSSKTEQAAADDPATIPDTEGLEPCAKIPCQQVLRAIADIKYKNEEERDEIEDEYERLLQELTATEQEIAAAEAKFVLLNDIGGQLEMRANQLNEKANLLQSTKEAQDSERNDINGKLMVAQTEKNKRARGLDKAIKALSDATWRKKKQAQQDNIESGLSMATSEISDGPIVHTDASTVGSLSGIYKTSYDRLAAERVRDHIELPPTIKTLPPYMMDVMSKPQLVDGMDKYKKKHYKTLMENGVRSWEGMDGSLLTASIYSVSSHGHGPDILAQSYDEYSQIRVNKLTSTSVSTAVSSRVSSLLQSRQGSPKSQSTKGQSTNPATSLSASQSLTMLSRLVHSPRDLSPGSVRNRKSAAHGKSSHASKRALQKSASNGQIRLAPLNNDRNPHVVHASIGEAGLDGLSLDDGSEMDGFLYEGQNNSGDASISQYSSFSNGVSAYSGLNGASAYASLADSATADSHLLDPVFFKEQSRNTWGRKHAVGKLRKAEITWGMQSFVDPSKMDEEDEDEDILANIRMRRQGTGGINNSGMSRKNQSNAGSRVGTANTVNSLKYGHVATGPSTVKSRSLTVYHPNMQIFQDAVTLPKKKADASAR